MLDLALHLLVLDGLVALYLGEFLGPAATALLGAALGVSWGLGRRGWRPGAGALFLRAVVPLAAVGALVDLFYLSGYALDALVRLLLFLVFFKLLTLRTAGDARTVAGLAFFMLVTASTAAVGVGVLLVLVAFLVLAVWVLLLAEAAGAGDPRTGSIVVLPGRRGSLLGVALVAAAGTAVVTAAVFLVIPRVGLAILPFRSPTGPLVTGFASQVDLGAYGSIETDTTVVMRVYIPHVALDPEHLPPLRWRGVAFDVFDGRGWRVGTPAQRTVWRSAAGDFWVALPRGTGPTLHQEVFLEPLGTDVIFAAPRPVRFRLAGDRLGLDDMGSVRVSGALARLRYTVDSELESFPGRRPPLTGARLDPAERARFLQLPPLPPRIPALARAVASGAGDAWEAARRLTEYLAREFRYTLTLERTSDLEPLEEFLFVRRAGTCEYFAAALAVLLRSLGVPARVVGGFQRGEWNPYGRYFMVRLADAHAWVEAWVDGVGWVTFDPSPRAPGRSAAAAPWQLYLDALRTRWYRYVIGWSLRDQVQAAITLRRQVLDLGGWVQAVSRGVDVPPAVAAGAALLILAVPLLVRRGRGSPGRRPEGRTVRFYEQALRRLARQGLRPGPAETAREFCGRVAREAPDLSEPLARLTAAYERCRFGGRPLAPGEAAEVAAALAALGRR